MLADLILPAVIADDQGNQTNRTASVTVGSATALIAGYSLTADGFHLQFITQPGFNFVVEYTDDLAPMNWQPLVSILGDGSIH